MSRRYPVQPRARVEPSAKPDGWPEPKTRGEADAKGPAAERQAGAVLAYLFLLMRHKFLIVGLGVLSAVAAVGSSLLRTPLFEAVATVEIQGKNEDFLNMREINMTASEQLYNSQTYLETQVQMLRSRSLAAHVVDTLELDRDPFFAGADGGAAEGDGGGTNGKAGGWRAMLGLPAIPQPTARDRAITALQGGLQLSSSPETRIIAVSFAHQDGAVAAEVVNTLIGEHIQQSMAAQMGTIKHVGDLLSSQLGELRTQLEVSERQLQRHAEVSGIIPSEHSISVAEERLRLTQAALAQATSDRIAAQARYGLVANAPVETLPEILDSRILADVVVKLVDLRRERAALQVNSLPKDPRLKEVEAQIASHTAAVRQERTNILQRIRNEQDVAVEREKLLTEAYTNQVRRVSEESSKSIQYNALKREVEGNRRLFDNLLSKTKEASVAAAIRATSIRVIDHAERPVRPQGPRLASFGMIGFLSGAMLGAVLVLAHAAFDRKIRAPGTTRRILDVPELGAIPALRYDAKMLGRQGRRRRRAEPLPAPAQGSPSFHAVVRHLPLPSELLIWQKENSVIADSFRATLTSLLLGDQTGHAARVLAVTSPQSGDGKTTVASNLAMALAEIRHRTLLIDADMRKPSLHRLFGMQNDWGLADMLADPETLDCDADCMGRTTGVPGLWVLPAGICRDGPASILSTDRFTEYLQLAAQRFDFVLIDAPPLVVADARRIAYLAGSAILVFRAAQTASEQALGAREQLSQDGTPLLGTILNAWEPDPRTVRVYRMYH